MVVIAKLEHRDLRIVMFGLARAVPVTCRLQLLPVQSRGTSQLLKAVWARERDINVRIRAFILES
jgi:hypothetical protein